MLNIFTTVGAQVAEFMDEKIRNIKPEPIEVDECWTLVANKQAKGNTPDAGDFYAYLASGGETKLIASYVTGKREYESSDILILRDKSAAAKAPLR